MYCCLQTSSSALLFNISCISSLSSHFKHFLASFSKHFQHFLASLIGPSISRILKHFQNFQAFPSPMGDGLSCLLLPQVGSRTAPVLGLTQPPLKKQFANNQNKKRGEILIFTNFHQTFGEKMKRKHFGTEFAGGCVIAVHSSASSFGKCFSY